MRSAGSEENVSLDVTFLIKRLGKKGEKLGPQTISLKFYLHFALGAMLHDISLENGCITSSTSLAHFCSVLFDMSCTSLAKIAFVFILFSLFF